MLATHRFAFGAALGLFFAASLTFGSSNGKAPAHDATPATVVNPTDIAKAERIQHPFGSATTCTPTQSGDLCEATIDLSASPNANQHIVLEYISGECTIESGLPVEEVIAFTTVSGNSVAQIVPVLDHLGVGNGAENRVAIGQVVRDYADPNSTITLRALAGRGGLADCDFLLTGQGIDR